MFEQLGLRPSVLAAGAAGGVLRALSARHQKWREILVSPICGALAAGYLTSIAVHYLRVIGVPLPDDPNAASGAVGFLIGVCGMWISDALLEIVARKIQPKPQA